MHLLILVIVVIVLVAVVLGLRRRASNRAANRITPPAPRLVVRAWTVEVRERETNVQTVYGPFPGAGGFMVAQHWTDLVDGLRPKRYLMEIIHQDARTITNDPTEVAQWPEYERIN